MFPVCTIYVVAFGYSLVAESHCTVFLTGDTLLSGLNGEMTFSNAG